MIAECSGYCSGAFLAYQEILLDFPANKMLREDAQKRIW